MYSDILIQPVSYDWAALALRLVVGIALLPFAIEKFLTREERADKFYGILFFSPKEGFYLAMLVEGLCALCMILGFATRIMAIPGIVNMGIATNKSRGKYWTSPAQCYLLGFIAILLVGPGKYSLDWLIIKHFGLIF